MKKSKRITVVRKRDNKIVNRNDKKLVLCKVIDKFNARPIV